MKISELLVISIICILTSCNNDIFIDRIDLPESTDVILEGDGGQWSATFSRKGLKRISLQSGEMFPEYLHVYNLEGNPVSGDIPVSKISEISYENPVKYYSLGLAGEKLYLMSHYNASYEDEFTILFEYDFGSIREIHVIITPGKPLTVINTIYNDAFQIEKDFATETQKSSLLNNSAMVQKIEIYPYLNAKCSDYVKVSDIWARTLEVDIPVISFNGMDWGYKESNIMLGGERHFSPSEYRHEKISIDVPPYSKATITYTLYYSRATQSGEIKFINNINDSHSATGFVCTSVYATDCTYTVDYE